jgi:hypothetical protein
MQRPGFDSMLGHLFSSYIIFEQIEVICGWFHTLATIQTCGRTRHCMESLAFHLVKLNGQTNTVSGLMVFLYTGTIIPIIIFGLLTIHFTIREYTVKNDGINTTLVFPSCSFPHQPLPFSLFSHSWMPEPLPTEIINRNSLT